MYAELTVKVFFNDNEIEALNGKLVRHGAEPMTDEELLGALVIRPSMEYDQLGIEPSGEVMLQEWSFVDGPFLLCNGEITDRKLVCKRHDEKGDNSE